MCNPYRNLFRSVAADGDMQVLPEAYAHHALYSRDGQYAAMPPPYAANPTFPDYVNLRPDAARYNPHGQTRSAASALGTSGDVVDVDDVSQAPGTAMNMGQSKVTYVCMIFAR
jgi:hypothetical protein